MPLALRWSLRSASGRLALISVHLGTFLVPLTVRPKTISDRMALRRFRPGRAPSHDRSTEAARSLSTRCALLQPALRHATGVA
eukprot:scaffold55253_cov61-Phaeocystis_antarctica.AAC.10